MRNIQEEFNEALQKPETVTVEFIGKHDFERLIQTICAFANTKGGTIYVGVSDTPDDPGTIPDRRSVKGIDLSFVEKVTQHLEDHFDLPYPEITEDIFVQDNNRPPDGPLVAIRVKRQNGNEPVALLDRTIWVRSGAQNATYETRVKLNRSSGEARIDLKDLQRSSSRGSIENELNFKQQVDVEIKRSENGANEAISLEKLLSLNLSEFVRDAVHAGLSMASGKRTSFPLDSSRLLFGLLQSGMHNEEIRSRYQSLGKWVIDHHSPDFGKVRDAYLSRLFDEHSGEARNDGVPQVTPVVWQIFLVANILRHRMKRSEEPLSERFVLAAMLLNEYEEPDGGALRRVEEMGIELEPLRRAFCETMVANAPESERAEWKKLFPRKSSQIANYNADWVAGESDQLNVTPDVNAMANLIASRGLKPPLSVGLFGNWGSGKSFFIEQLHRTIEQIKSDAKGDPDFGRHYWENIVQVKFNAWNYVDANLWASLVSHIFEQLSRWDAPKKSPMEEARAEAIKKLGVAKEAYRTANLRKRDAEKALEKANKNKNDRISEIEKSRKALIAAIQRDVWKEIGGNWAELKKQNKDTRELVDHLKTMGICVNEIEKSGQHVMAHFDEMSTLAGRLRTLWITLTSGVSITNSFWIGLSVASLGVLLVAFFFKSASPEFSWITALVGEAAVIVGGLATWVKSGADYVSKLMRPMQNLHAKVDSALKAAERDKASKIAEIKAQLEQKQIEYEIAVQEVDAAELAVEAAESEISDIDSGRLISRFIEQRVESGDYQKHLGIVATIRNDFDQLNVMISEFNEYLMEQEEKGNLQSENALPEKLQEAKNLGINRIVLYIDDLDRCPPERVVQVLQAIHLLLAFPLFVVVVAVDSRWMSYALQDQYPHLLVDPNAPVTGNGDQDTGKPQNGAYSASPRDYLEKIFQVPYWIQTMDSDGCRNLIDYLTATDLQKEDRELASDDQTGTDSVQTSVSSADDMTELTKDSNADRERTARSDSESAETDDDSRPRAAQQMQKLAPESLALEPAEVSAMKELAPIIGRSPRETKRFVNIYRLMKASLPAHELASYLGTDRNPGTFRERMFLLALATGSPQIAGKFFDNLHQIDDKTKSVSDVIDSLGFDNDESGERSVKRLRNFLTQHTHWASLNIVALKPQIPRVSQFSFNPTIVRVDEVLKREENAAL